MADQRSSPDADGSVAVLWRIGAGAAIAGLSVVVYWQAILSPFVEDDWVYLNEVQRHGWWVSAAIWKPGMILWRPFLFVWFGLLHLAFGLHPLAYHLATESAVLVEAYLTYRLARLIGLRTGALLAGALICLHASMAQPVAWTSAASSPLSVSLALGSLLLLYRERPGILRHLAAVTLFAFALLTREIVLVTPAVVVVLGIFCKRGPPWRERLRSTLVASASLWATLAGYVVVRIGFGLQPSGPYQQRLSAHAVSNLAQLMRSAGDLVLPGRPLVTDMTTLAVWCGLIAASIWSLRAGHYQAAAGLLWAFLGVLPVVFLVNHFMAYYYVDFSLPGLGLAGGTVVDQVVERYWSGPRARAGVLVVTIGTIGLASWFVARSEFNSTLAGPVERTAALQRRLRLANPRPVDGTVRLTGLHNTDVYITGDGDMYRVLLHDPNLRIISEVPLREPNPG